MPEFSYTINQYLVNFIVGALLTDRSLIILLNPLPNLMTGSTQSIYDLHLFDDPCRFFN